MPTAVELKQKKLNRKFKIDLRKLSQHFNPLYWGLVTCSARYLVLYGGAGSGKSVAASEIIAYRAMNEGPGHNFGLFRKVYRTCRGSVHHEFEKTLDRMGQQIRSLWHCKVPEMQWTFLPTGNTVQCYGMENETGKEKLKSIALLTSTWIEEANEFSYEDFKEIDRRMRGQTPGRKQHILTFNPVDALSWLRARFFERSDLDNVYVCHSTFQDNLRIDEKYKEILQEYQIEGDDYDWQVYGLGEWGQIGGLIYRPYTLVSKFPSRFDDTWYGLDFGYTHPMALIECNSKLVSTQKFPDIHLVELLYERQLQVSELIKGKPSRDVEPLEQMLRNGKRSFIWCDSADPDKIAELRAAGFNAQPADKKVKDGLDFCKRFKYHTLPGNINLNRERSAYRYKKDRVSGDELDDKPIKTNDHLMDAKRYAVYTHLQHLATKKDAVQQQQEQREQEYKEALMDHDDYDIEEELLELEI